jgi:sec-independent protein translocase protein TatA
MPFPVGPLELIILLVIVIAIFGAGKLSSLGGAVGRSIRDFRSATKDEEPARPS